MAEELALYEVDGGVAVITMNRPDKRNALNAAVGMVGLLHVSKIESDQRFYDKVAAEGPAAAFRWRNAQFVE